MICLAKTSPSDSSPSPATDEAAENPEGCSPCSGRCSCNPYGSAFWMAYAANVLVAVALGLTYRYADFVTFLGGTEFHLGWIVGVGMVGSVLARLSLGVGIDRHGPRLVWLASILLLVLTCLAHRYITRYDDVPIYLARIAFCTALAGVWSASTTFIAARVPLARMAELVGMLGTSGFLGIMVGTQLGDLFCTGPADQRDPINRMFLLAGLLGAVALPFAWAATRQLPPPMRHRRTPVLGILVRYQSPVVLMVGAVVGAAIALPATFLRTYAAEREIPRIGLFFTVWAVVALVTRFLARQADQRFGQQRMILAGLGLMAVSQFLFLAVYSEWQLAIPGLFFGAAQAILYPMIMAAGSGPFPLRHRGLGTTLNLAAFDVGQLVGAPTAGVILHFSQRAGLPSYAAMFLSMAVVLAAAGLVFALRQRRVPRLAARTARMALPSANGTAGSVRHRVIAGNKIIRRPPGDSNRSSV